MYKYKLKVKDCNIQIFHIKIIFVNKNKIKYKNNIKKL